jgi:hypothetical protein
MDALKAFDAIKNEFGVLIALSVLQIHTINMVTKVKKSDMGAKSNRTERVLKKAKKLLSGISDDEYELALKVWSVLHDWDVRQNLKGLGGCETKTFLELIVSTTP